MPYDAETQTVLPSQTWPMIHHYDTDAARAEEVCNCGRVPVIVYLTDEYGRVPFCGVPGPANPPRVERSDYPIGYEANLAQSTDG